MIFLYVFIPIIILLILLFSSRGRVVENYKKYTRIANQSGLTGEEVANIIINQKKLNIQYTTKDADLCDAYYPGKKVLLMSKKVYNTPSVASVAIVCHELGHALQHKENTLLYKLDSILSAITRVTNKLIVPLLISGLLLYTFRWPNELLGQYLCIAAGVMFALQALVKILIIPLEFDASKRAIKLIEENNFLSKKELRMSKRFLNTAGQTYIVALFDGIGTTFKKFFKLIK